MKPSPRNPQHGSVMLVLVALILAAMSFVIVKALNSSTEAGRNETNAAVLSQAKQALIGFAATYRDTPAHANEVFGYLPCPDTDNNGTADSCGATNVSLIGRLPWRTLGLPPLRDSAGECLWYAVSGRAKDLPKTAAFNWDTNGQFRIEDADGAVLVVAGTHDTPLAVVFAPGAVIPGQARAPLGNTECGGNITTASYLESAAISLAANANSTLTLATRNSIQNNTNNDQGQWITSNEIFERVQVRRDFKDDDIDPLLNDIQVCLNDQAVASLPAAAGSTGIDNVITVVNNPTTCPGAAGLQKGNVRSNWRDNLLYAKPLIRASINGGAAECYAVLFFGGERTTRTTAPLNAQTRINADKNDPNMYLENPNDGLFPNNGNYTGASNFSSLAASTDLVRCIKGLPAGASQTSFANDFGSFITAGTGVTLDSTYKTVTIANTAGTSGGCFWLPGTVIFAGKTVRAYYDYKFSFADPTGGQDRGNGITLDIVDGSIGSPTAFCGLASRMGAFVVGDPTGMWALESFTLETDVYRDAANNDSVENHTAIMANGNPAHSAANGNLTSACDGTAAGCQFSLANKFEEAPTPLLHNQRVEIHSGCNSTCSSCNPASHVSPNTYVKISTWVDCINCNDVVTDGVKDVATGSAILPTINRCINLNPALNSPYISLTGGFRSGAAIQSVTLSNFILRSE